MRIALAMLKKKILSAADRRGVPVLTCTWRTPSITRFVQWVGAAFLVFALAVASGAGTASGPGSSAAVDKGIVASFLSQLRQAQTAEQASALLAGAKFSEDELRQIDRELAKPEWAQKLASFQQTVKRSTPARPTVRAHTGKSVSQVLDETRQTLVRAHRERIQRGEQALRARAAGQRATTGSARVQVTARAAGTTGATLPSTTVRAQVQRPDWPSHISDFEPRAPIVGQPLTVIGGGFGSARGTVMFLVGEHLFEAEVTGWTSSRITVRVPQDVLPWDDMGDVPDDVPRPRGGSLGRDCEVWIRLQDGRWGGWRPLGVFPDMERLTPTITAITPAEATPGGSMMIEGANFGRQQGYGNVSLIFGGGAMEVAVREWRNDQIILQVAEDISRLQAMSGGTIKVTNRLQREAVRTGVSFVPAEDVQELRGRKAVVMCHPAGHPLFCWVGDRREFTAFDFQLRNGWTVDESWIDVREIGVNAGAYFERQAERGDTHAYARMVVWADGLSRAEATPYMIIKGPRGTFPR